MKINVFIQARMGSSRLSGKVMLPLEEKPIIEWVVERLRRIPEVSEVVVTTSTLPADDLIESYTQKIGVKCFRGDEENVLSRYYHTYKKYPCDAIIRATCDNPLVDSVIASKIINLYLKENADYATGRGFPLGSLIEIFSPDALKAAYKNAVTPKEFEHVTPYIIKHAAKSAYLTNIPDMSSYRFTIDTNEDYLCVKEIFKHFVPNSKDFMWQEVVKFLDTNPEIRAINAHVVQRS